MGLQTFPVDNPESTLSNSLGHLLVGFHFLRRAIVVGFFHPQYISWLRRLIEIDVHLFAKVHLKPNFSSNTNSYNFYSVDSFSLATLSRQSTALWNLPQVFNLNNWLFCSERSYSMASVLMLENAFLDSTDMKGSDYIESTATTTAKKVISLDPIRLFFSSESILGHL